MRKFVVFVMLASGAFGNGASESNLCKFGASESSVCESSAIRTENAIGGG